MSLGGLLGDWRCLKKPVVCLPNLADPSHLWNVWSAARVLVLLVTLHQWAIVPFWGVLVSLLMVRLFDLGKGGHFGLCL